MRDQLGIGPGTRRTQRTQAVIAVDINVLVRLLVNDGPDQAAKARRFFDAQAERDAGAWVSDTVLVELCWVLLRAYGRARADLVVALRALAANATVHMESPQAVTAALSLFERSSADFADCLLCAKARLAGCSGVVTFDRGMKALEGVKLL